MIQLALEGQQGEQRPWSTAQPTLQKPLRWERGVQCGARTYPSPMGCSELMGAAGESQSGKERQGLVCAQAAGPEQRARQL